MVEVKLPEVLSSKEAFCKAVDYGDGKMHIAWELEDGKIIAFEWIPENYPQGGLYVFEDREEYMKSIPEWVYDKLEGGGDGERCKDWRGLEC